MKKLLFTFSLVLTSLFIGLNTTYASTASPTDAYVPNFYGSYSDLVMIDENYQSVISALITYYNTNLSSDYSNYIINITKDPSNYWIHLYGTNYSEIQALQYSSNSNHPQIAINKNTNAPTKEYRATINRTDNSVSYSLQDSYIDIFNQLLYTTKIPLTFVDSSQCLTHNYPCFDSMTIPSYSDLTYDVAYPVISIEDGDTLPTYQTLTSGTTPTGFTSVNLSSYDYIILSLKDYTQEPFNTTIYTQGSLCFTPVYNYGMQQKQDSIPGYQTAGCTEVYSTDTPVNVYIIQSDITNHAVYYIKQQQNVPTTLKIPTSIFDITYITTNNSDPQVVIGGRSYPVIPFDDLTDTANKSSNEGYISGRVCSLGDVNCQAETMGMDISDLFTSPLTLLQTLWTSITSIFTIITTFITILPPTLQVFLYTSFMLGIILGIIKIIL